MKAQQNRQKTGNNTKHLKSYEDTTKHNKTNKLIKII
jgi:hypothetical protein